MTLSGLAAAVVGTGFIGPVHVEALRRAGVPIAGILGSTPDKSRRAAEQLGLPLGYDSFAALLADPAVAAVHLTTPNRFHFEQATAALQAGKHVLCEKPLAMNSQESAALVRLARDCDRAAAVAYNIRFYPLCQEAGERMRTRSVGELLHVQGSYVQDWLLWETDFNWRVLAAEGGELRAVADIGTHWLDLVQFVTGANVAAVCADLRTVHPTRRRPLAEAETFGAETFTGSAGKNRPSEAVPIDTEDCGCVMLRFENGANGTLWVSQTTAGRKNCLRFEIAGSQQTLAWDSQSPNELWIGRRDRPNELLVRDPALLGESARQATNYPGGHNEGFPDTFKQLFRRFYAEIASGAYRTAPSYPTFADGHREIRLCEAILASHRQRRWIDLGDEPVS